VTLRLKRICEEIRGFRAEHKCGNVKFGIACIPPQDGYNGFLDRSLKDPCSREIIGNILKNLHVRRAIAPSVGDASGLVMRDSFFSETTSLTEQITLHNNPSSPADGTSLPFVGDALIMGAAGCKVFVAAGRNALVAAHGALKSMVDVDGLLTDQVRPHTSVIESMSNAVASLGVSPRNTTLFGFLGIQSRHLSYEFHHDHRYAKLLGCRHGVTSNGHEVSVDLDAIAKVQGKQANFRKVVSHYPLPNDTVFANTRHINHELHRPRNLTVVVRLAA
jgi:hypothetical protein